MSFSQSLGQHHSDQTNRALTLPIMSIFRAHLLNIYNIYLPHFDTVVIRSNIKIQFYAKFSNPVPIRALVLPSTFN